MFYLKKFLFLGISLISVSASAAPFWKAEREGKQFYILGTFHRGVSLSELQCHETIEDKLKQSGFVFTEIKLLDLDIEKIKKLHLGSKKEKEEIMNQLNEDDKKAARSRYNMLRLIITHHKLLSFQEQGFAFKKDQGKFEDLSQKSQDFIERYGLYDEDKSYYDYLFDFSTRVSYEVYHSFQKRMDIEITELARGNDIPIKELDNTNNTISDLEEEIKQLEKAKVEQNLEITNEVIDQLIEAYVINYVENYEETKKVNIESVKLYEAPPYKKEDWSSFGEIESDAILKNRNEIWVEKILSSSENTDKALFVAGGAVHFVSSDNVLDMLEDEGFTITKINEENCQF